MKKISIIKPLLFIAIIVMGIYTSCKKDQSTQGTPVINYVRICNPLSSDSLLVAAGQGQYIAIMGQNLGSAVQIWFNNQPAQLLSTYVTNSSIIVAVPTQIPTVVSNKMKLIFSNGDSLLYNFSVTINKPLISSMLCEYVADGGTATIIGNYFYAPIKVYFSGVSAPVEIDSLGDQIIKVTVPAGVQPGQIKVVTNFGVTSSDFWFRDNRNIICDSDPFRGWWDATLVVTNPGPNDPPAISGNYIRVRSVFGSWSYNQVAGGDPGSMAPLSQNIPDDAILNPSKYYLKFELNTMKPYNGSDVRLRVGCDTSEPNDYIWAPPYDSHGLWNTIAIPFESVQAALATGGVVRPGGYFFRLIFQGPGDLVCDMSFDNFRVVPKVIIN